MSLELNSSAKDKFSFFKKWIPVLKIIFFVLSVVLVLLWGRPYPLQYFDAYVAFCAVFGDMLYAVVGDMSYAFVDSLFLITMGVVLFLLYHFFKWFFQKISFWEFCEQNENVLVFILPSALGGISLPLLEFYMQHYYKKLFFLFYPLCLMFGILNLFFLGLLAWKIFKGFKRFKTWIKILVCILLILFVLSLVLNVFSFFSESFLVSSLFKFVDRERLFSLLYFLFTILNLFFLGLVIWKVLKSLKNFKVGIRILVYAFFVFLFPLLFLTILSLSRHAILLSSMLIFVGLTWLFCINMFLKFFLKFKESKLLLFLQKMLNKIKDGAWVNILICILLIFVVYLAMLHGSYYNKLLFLGFLLFVLIIIKIGPNRKKISLLTAIPFYISFIAPVLIVFATFSTVCINLKHQGIAYFSPQEKFKTGEVIHPIRDVYNSYQKFLDDFLDQYRLKKDSPAYLLETQYDFSYAIQSFFSEWKLGYLHPIDLKQVGGKTSCLIRIQKGDNYVVKLGFEENKSWSKEKKDQFNKLFEERMKRNEEKIKGNNLLKVKLKITALNSFSSKTNADLLGDKDPMVFQYSRDFSGSNILRTSYIQSYHLAPGIYRIEFENLDPFLEEIECKVFLQIYREYKESSFFGF